ncbi:transcriptional regulator [Bacillus toyonensis]|uniref:transcriptional regulator n=1 Tax=Bacillus toyonensis TaxID=155322 RepID=UPI000BF080BB|nr:transcriptional regulator [Bacillus toyonensis]PEP03814.1 transcriptional regulator [Bacillus toyonensis]
MKQLTTIKYDVKQLCSEILKITVQRFRNKKEHYINILKQDYYVTIETGARNKEFFILELKENGITVLKDVTPKTNELKRNDLKNIELILKAVLIDNVLPMPEEIAKNIGKSKSTVRRLIAKMYDNDILLEPDEEIVQMVNKYTGEIFEYVRKKYSYIYYDNLSNGERIVVDLPTIHNAYGEFYNEKMQELMHKHKHWYNHKTAQSVSNIYVWEQMNETFDLRSARRTEKWIVSNEYRKLIIEKYSRQLA